MFVAKLSHEFSLFATGKIEGGEGGEERKYFNMFINNRDINLDELQIKKFKMVDLAMGFSV